MSEMVIRENSVKAYLDVAFNLVAEYFKAERDADDEIIGDIERVSEEIIDGIMEEYNVAGTVEDFMNDFEEVMTEAYVLNSDKVGYWIS